MAITTRPVRAERRPREALRSKRLSRRARQRLKMAFAYFVVGLWALFSIFPVFWTYLSSIKPPQDVFVIPPKWEFTPTLQNYKVVLGLIVSTERETVQETYEGAVRSQLPQHILNTVVVSVGSPPAYALARARIRFRRLILTSILLTRLIPPIVIVIPLYLIWRDLQLLDTLPGLILAFFVFTLPFVIWMMRAFFLSVPVELEEASLIDGSSRWGALLRVAVPLAAPGLATTAIFTMLFAWNEFLVAAMLGGEDAKLLTPSIFGFVSERSILWGELYAASGLVILPVVVLTLFVQKHVATGLTGGALKG